MMSDAMKPIVLDDSLTNSDWVKQGKYGFDFPFVETVEDFEREFKIPVDEPARGKRLEELAKLVWVEVAPEPIRDLLLGVRKSVVLRRMAVRRDAMVRLALSKASFGGDRSAAGRYAAEQRWKGHQKKDEMPKKVFTGFILDDIARYATETVPKAEYIKLSIHDTDAGKALETQIAKKLESQHSPLELYVAHTAVDKLSSFAGGELYGVQFPADVALQKVSVMPEATASKTVEELVKVIESTPEYKAGDEGMVSLWRGVRHPLVTPERQFGAPSQKMVGQLVNIWTEGGFVGKGIWSEIIRQEFGIEEARQGKPESASAETTNEITDRYAGSMKVFRSAARAIYEQTQELLAGVLPAGTTHVQLYRGTGFTDEELKEANAGTVQISPITSFSDSRLRAYQFEAKSKVDTTKGFITAPVPVSKIFGLGTQRFGMSKEEEVVVMGPSLSNIKIELPPAVLVSWAAFMKASFGGDRSAAGRYAAEQRWQGHVKADAEQILRVRGGIIDTVRREEGMSVKIDSGLQPKDGYMVARKEYSKIVSAEDFFDATKGKKILGDFLKENRERFQKDQYLGIWWNTKTGKVYLDITDNISDREKAESLGKERNQISIWDVVNKVEIQTGGTGEG